MDAAVHVAYNDGKHCDPYGTITCMTRLLAWFDYLMFYWCYMFDVIDVELSILSLLASIPCRGFTVESSNRSWPYTLCTFECKGKKKYSYTQKTEWKDYTWSNPYLECLICCALSLSREWQYVQLHVFSFIKEQRRLQLLSWREVVLTSEKMWCFCIHQVNHTYFALL